MDIPIHIVDAFSKIPFAGNPAAVCLLESDMIIDDDRKQKIAAEMNLSETAFVSCERPTENFSTADKFTLRWFTPSIEEDLCGHATLATATVIFKQCGNINREIKFNTRSGSLSAVLRDDLIALNFPQQPGHSLDVSTREELGPLLDVCSFLGPHSIQDVVYSPSGKLLVRLNDSLTMDDLANLPVDPNRLFAACQTKKVRGVILTVRGSLENGCVDPDGAAYDFISRYFGPWVGIPEDPVTGSSHTVLGPYWGDVLKKTKLYARQCSKRGGDLTLILDHASNRVDIAGHSKLVMSGRLTL